MSIRAYRINKVDYKTPDTFNLWHDINLVEKLEEMGYLSKLNMNGEGIIEVPVYFLEELIKEGNIENEVIKALQDDINWAKENKQEFLQYYCF